MIFTRLLLRIISLGFVTLFFIPASSAQEPRSVHFHMLFLDGVYAGNKHGSSGFRWLKAPSSDELTQLTHTIAHRFARYLERHQK
jgi:hypothetical protein